MYYMYAHRALSVRLGGELRLRTRRETTGAPTSTIRGRLQETRDYAHRALPVRRLGCTPGQDAVHC